MLDGHPTFAPGELLVLERRLRPLALMRSGRGSRSTTSSGSASAPAGMVSGVPALDELHGRTALGYAEIDGAWRTTSTTSGPRQRRRRHLLHRRGHERALAGVLCGRIVPESCARYGAPHSDDAAGMRYGLGFWLHSVTSSLVGSDGVSFTASGTGHHTVVSNTSDGAGRSPGISGSSVQARWTVRCSSRTTRAARRATATSSTETCESGSRPSSCTSSSCGTGSRYFDPEIPDRPVRPARLRRSLPREGSPVTCRRTRPAT